MEHMQLYRCNYSIFIDGSFQKGPLADTYILMSSSEATAYGSASAALVAIADSDNWKNLPASAVMLRASDDAAPGLNAYSAELIALTAAVHVQRITSDTDIFTDCKSALTTIFRACSSTAKRSQLTSVRAVTNSLLGFDRPNITWKRSHPERHHADSSSDLAAKGDYNAMSQYHDNITYATTPLTSLLTDLIPSGLWYWAKINTITPTLLSPIKSHAANRVPVYLENRDSERTKRIMKAAAAQRPQDMPQDDIDIEEDALWIQSHRWTDTSLGLANRCWRTIAKGIIQSNVILKNVLDKYWHGRNRAKDSSAPNTSALCRICNAVDSQVHILLQCHHPDLEDIRSNAIDNVHLLSSSTPLCEHARNIIAFFTSNFTDAEYPNVDRLWLGTWNKSLLRAALCNGSMTTSDDMSYDTAIFIQGIIIKLTEPLVKATKKLMFQSHKAIAQLDNTPPPPPDISLCGQSYPQTVAKSPFAPPSTRLRSAAIRPRSARSAPTAPLPSQRSKQINRRRRMTPPTPATCTAWISNVEDAQDHAASPHGATESCDYDKD